MPDTDPISSPTPTERADKEEFRGDVFFGRTAVPVPNRNIPLKKDKLGFEYAEHCFVGDAINLTLANGKSVPASSHKFVLKNALNLTYGQINGLAGDFYGTDKPVSNAEDWRDATTRFLSAFATLADVSPRQPKEATDILAVLQAEVDAVNNALKNKQDPSVVYATLPNVDVKLWTITYSRPAGQPTYLGLAHINWDHFADHARRVYDVGHAAAISLASRDNLEGAYALNAFADHFLVDSFSAGHLRTPRKDLHSSAYQADRCARYMHDEDCAIGLLVKNADGTKSWTALGDKRALDKADETNKTYCVAAVQASADEVYNAFKTKRPLPLPVDYKAWKWAPTLASANTDTQQLAPLYKIINGILSRRYKIADRKTWNYKRAPFFLPTANACYMSGRWNYPITLNATVPTLSWSSIAITASQETQSVRLFRQIPGGDIVDTEYNDGSWGSTESARKPVVNAVLFTPLAALSWLSGKEARIFYLDKEYTVQEYCYSAGTDTWVPGTIGGLKIQAATNSAIAANRLISNRGEIHIRVFLQEANSTAITQFEYRGNGPWFKSEQSGLDALAGSGIAAVTNNNSSSVKLYYQADDLSIREHILEQGHWKEGAILLTGIPGCVPISAVCTDGDSSEVHVYCLNLENEIVGRTYRAGEWGPVTKVAGALKSGNKFTATQMMNGKQQRVYYQAHDNALIETYKDTDTWIQGATVARGSDDADIDAGVSAATLVNTGEITLVIVESNETFEIPANESFPLNSSDTDTLVLAEGKTIARITFHPSSYCAVSRGRHVPNALFELTLTLRA